MPSASQVFPTLPIPPEAEFVSRSGSSDALQLTFRSTLPPPNVANYYRNLLTHGKWRLIGDTHDSTGAVSLYAEQDGPPLWVRVWWDDKASATMVSLTGAVVAADTAKRAGAPKS
jgi:hypothetical protein